MGLLNKNKIGLLAIALILLIGLLVLNTEYLTIERIAGYAEVSIWTTALGFLVVYAIMGVTMAIPKSLLYIAAGIAFPTWIGVGVTYVGLAVSASIGHAMGKRLG
ncbi:MAG: VTT domain-containing protein, partial [Oscillospiraceae bacterium]|nr:VTT domain-containing protein [Oscillospiraceae bacterium]